VDEKNPEQPKIKVVDRRKFSSEGDPLDSSEPNAETPAPAADGACAERSDHHATTRSASSAVVTAIDPG